MSHDTATQSEIDEIEDDLMIQLSDSTPKGIIKIIIGQILIARDAKQRIADEGIVVRNIGGLIIPHPAIKIQNDAEKIVAGLIGKYSGN